MKYALFLGCNIPARVSQYETSARAVLQQLNVDLVDLPEFVCCGYPARNNDQLAYLVSAARNMAIAAAAGLDMLVLCKCCYGSLKKAQHLLDTSATLREQVNAVISSEGRPYDGAVKVKHLLTVMHHDIGLEKIRQQVQQKFSGLQIAVSYGCHALRPSEITGFDDPVSPVLFDELVEITGAFSVAWDRKLDCCGAPLTGINDDLAREMALKKINSAKQSGAHFICTACPYSHLQFDWVQDRMLADARLAQPMPAILYSQLVGLSMSIGAEELALEHSRIDIQPIKTFLQSE